MLKINSKGEAKESEIEEDEKRLKLIGVWTDQESLVGFLDC